MTGETKQSVVGRAILICPPIRRPPEKVSSAIDLQSVTYKDRAGIPAIGNVPKHVEGKKKKKVLST